MLLAVCAVGGVNCKVFEATSWVSNEEVVVLKVLIEFAWSVYASIDSCTYVHSGHTGMLRHSTLDPGAGDLYI